jgi:class 3 adenylate cyclase
MMSGAFPEVHYTDVEGVAIAYEVRGGGPVDLVCVPRTITSLVATTLDPVVARFFERLASFARLIRLDKRGMGMSDPVVAGDTPPLEQQVADVLAVMDAVGSDRAALYGAASGGQVALLCAALHPERVTALILSDTVARYLHADDYPWGMTIEARDRTLRALRERWGDLDQPAFLYAGAPSRVGDKDWPRTIARMEQLSASKSAAVAEVRAYYESDVREVLPLVHAPTLIMYPEAVGWRRDGARYLAEHLIDARLLSVPGTDMAPFGADYAAQLAATTEQLLTGVRSAVPADRVLAAVLFTDIVGSTERATELGDRAWRELLERFRAVVRDELSRFRGREIDTRGDDFLATFDGPARAIRCGFAINAATEQLGIKVRTGVHTGEVELMGDGISGIAVHIGARVCALAGPGEVLTTSTVRDLVAGSGLTFTDHGQHSLKGIPGTWTIFAAHE